MLMTPADLNPTATFWLDVSDKALKALAVLLGGAWTWMNYRRSRTYKQRLESGIAGEIFQQAGHFYLSIVCHLKNVGLGLYEIRQKGTACVVTALRRDSDGRIQEDRLKTLSVFTEHQWIEPGEPIDDPLLVEVPSPDTFVALRVSLRVVAGGIEWNSKSDVRIKQPSAEAVPARDRPHELAEAGKVTSVPGRQDDSPENTRHPLSASPVAVPAAEVLSQKQETPANAGEIETQTQAEEIILAGETVTIPQFLPSFRRFSKTGKIEVGETCNLKEDFDLELLRKLQAIEDPDKTDEIEKQKREVIVTERPARFRKPAFVAARFEDPKVTDDIEKQKFEGKIT